MDTHQPYNFHLGAPALPTVAEPSGSPPQSVPGRRTPLGAVGLGGFYAHGSHPGSSMHQQQNADENRPSGTSERGSSGIPGPPGPPGAKPKNRQGKTVRLNINAR